MASFAGEESGRIIACPAVPGEILQIWPANRLRELSQREVVQLVGAEVQAHDLHKEIYDIMFTTL